jgi:hypothetical protein
MALCRPISWSTSPSAARISAASWASDGPVLSGRDRLASAMRAAQLSNVLCATAPWAECQAAYGSAEVIRGAIARSTGGACAAACHCGKPMYEAPHIPTAPSHHGCPAIQVRVSTVSLSSKRCGSSRPGESAVPRTSWTTTR